MLIFVLRFYSIYRSNREKPVFRSNFILKCLHLAHTILTDSKMLENLIISFKSLNIKIGIKSLVFIFLNLKQRSGRSN